VTRAHTTFTNTQYCQLKARESHFLCLLKAKLIGLSLHRFIFISGLTAH